MVCFGFEKKELIFFTVASILADRRNSNKAKKTIARRFDEIGKKCAVLRNCQVDKIIRSFGEHRHNFSTMGVPVTNSIFVRQFYMWMSSSF